MNIHLSHSAGLVGLAKRLADIEASIGIHTENGQLLIVVTVDTLIGTVTGFSIIQAEDISVAHVTLEIERLLEPMEVLR